MFPFLWIISSITTWFLLDRLSVLGFIHIARKRPSCYVRFNLCATPASLFAVNITEWSLFFRFSSSGRMSAFGEQLLKAHSSPVKESQKPKRKFSSMFIFFFFFDRFHFPLIFLFCFRPHFCSVWIDPYLGECLSDALDLGVEGVEVHVTHQLQEVLADLVSALVPHALQVDCKHSHCLNQWWTLMTYSHSNRACRICPVPGLG